MKLYLIRHGETDSNKERRTMGQICDVPLNEQARELGALLPDDIEIVYSSPLKRAYETAQHMLLSSKREVPIAIHHALAERNLGKLSGVLHSDIQDMFGEPWEVVRSKDLDPKWEVENIQSI